MVSTRSGPLVLTSGHRDALSATARSWVSGTDARCGSARPRIPIDFRHRRPLADAWPSRTYFGWRAVGERDEVRREHRCELRRLPVVGVLVGPGGARIEELGRDVRAGQRNLEAEHRVGPRRNVGKTTIERRSDHGPGV